MNWDIGERRIRDSKWKWICKNTRDNRRVGRVYHGSTWRLWRESTVVSKPINIWQSKTENRNVKGATRTLGQYNSDRRGGKNKYTHGYISMREEELESWESYSIIFSEKSWSDAEDDWEWTRQGTLGKWRLQSLPLDKSFSMIKIYNCQEILKAWLGSEAMTSKYWSATALNGFSIAHALFHLKHRNTMSLSQD